MTDFSSLAERYVAVWNEPDTEQRRQQIAALWAEDGVHYAPSQVALGHAQIESRIAIAYTQWIGTGDHRFVLAGSALGHHDGLRLYWHMVRKSNGKTEAVGLDFLLLLSDGRIKTDYQFIEPTPKE